MYITPKTFACFIISFPISFSMQNSMILRKTEYMTNLFEKYVKRLLTRCLNFEENVDFVLKDIKTAKSSDSYLYHNLHTFNSVKHSCVYYL